MLHDNNDLGASLFKSWNVAQRREEIGKLVAGYRNGLSAGILCKMAETIAGNRKLARKELALLMTLEERRDAVEKESLAMQEVVRKFLL
jgi:hypothetical protein